MDKAEKNTLAHASVEKVCRLLGDVTPEQIWSKERTFKTATARQLVMWYLTKVCDLGYNETARLMGKTHPTIMYGVQQVEIMLERNRTKEDRRIYNAAMELKGEKKVRLEDRIIYEINAADFVFDGKTCVKHVETEFGYVGVSATVMYDWHCEDHDTELDGRYYYDGTEYVADELAEISVDCWDMTTEEEISVDTAYIATMI